MLRMRWLPVMPLLAGLAACQDAGTAAPPAAPPAVRTAAAPATVAPASGPAVDAAARRFSKAALMAERQGDFDAALSLHEEAAALCQGLDGPVASGACPAISSYLTGVTWHRRARFDEALAPYETAMAAVPADFPALKAAIFDRLGDIAAADRDSRNACRYYGEAYVLHKQSGFPKVYRDCPGIGD